MTRPSCIWHVRLAVDTAEAADVAAVAVAVALAVALAHALWRAGWAVDTVGAVLLGVCTPGNSLIKNTGKFDFESYTSETDLETAATVQHPTLLPVFCPCLRFGDPATSAHHGAVPVDRFTPSNEGPWRAPSDHRPPPPLPCRAFRCPKLRSRRAFPLLLAARVRVRPPPLLWRCPGDLRIQCESALLAVRFGQRAARPIAAVCTGHGRVEWPGQGLGPPPALPTA